MRARLISGVAGLLLGLAVPAAATAQNVLAAPPPTKYVLDDRGVDVRLGTFNLSTTDVSIGPAEGGMTYSRTFAGSGWRDNLTSTGQATSTTNTVLSLGGYSEAFTKSGSVFTPVIPNGATLTLSGLITTWTWADGTVVIIDGSMGTYYGRGNANSGRITSMTRPNGEKTIYSYEIAEFETRPERAVRLSSAINNQGYGLFLNYAQPWTPTGPEQFPEWTRIAGVTGGNLAYDNCDEQACFVVAGPRPSASYIDGTSVSSVTDALGNVTSYTYNATTGQMTSVRLPGSTSDDVTIAYASGKVSSVTTTGNAWTYGYADSAGVRTTTITDPLAGVSTAVSNISAGQLTSWTDPLSHTTTYGYSSGRLSSASGPTGIGVNYVYDARGNITQTTTTPISGSGLSPIVTSATYPGSCTVRVTCNKPVTTTDERGAVTNYSWNTTHGGLTSVQSPAPTSGAVRPETRITYGTSYAWVRDISGTLGQAATPITLPTATLACATLTSCAGGADEVKTTVVYGAPSVPNNLVPTSTTSGNGTGTLAATTTVTYSGNGDVETVDGPLSGAGDTTRYRYDLDRRLVGVVGPDPDGGGALLNRAQRLTYNVRSQVTLTEVGTTTGYTDPNWSAFVTLQRQAAEYDTYGRPVVARSQSADGTSHAVAQVNYDALNRTDCVATRMNPAVFGSLPSSPCTLSALGAYGPDRIVKTAYDAASRPTSTVSGYGSGGTITETVTYAVDNQPLTLTDGAGNTSIIVYDGFGRPSRLRYPNATGGGTSTTDYEEYTYDAASNVTAFRNRAGQTITAGFDALNRQTALGGSAAARTLSYDNLNRPIATVLTGGGPSSTNTWDALSRLLSQAQSPLGTVAYQYDLAGRRTQITWPGSPAYYAAYEYNLANDLTAIRENGATSGPGVLAIYLYDNLGRRVTTARGNGASTGYVYDGVSRLSQLIQDPTSTANDVTLTYAYNPAGQIVSRSVSNSAYVYVPTTASTTYANNGLNQVTALTGTGAASIAYDANKNITTGLGTTYGYNAESQLTTAGTAGLTYDPVGRLYSTSVGAIASRFLYDGQQVIGEYDAGGTMVSRYVPGLGLDDVVASYAGSGTTSRTWLLADERQSVMALTNGSGAAVSVNTYDEYGVPSSANAGRFQYTGQMWLPEVGLYHYRARAYAPQIGRFLQTDPMGYAAGANLYGYVGGDPVNWTDPLGFQGKPVLPPIPQGCSRITGGGLPGYDLYCKKDDFGSSGGLGNLVSYSGPGGGTGAPRGFGSPPISNGGPPLNDKYSSAMQLFRLLVSRSPIGIFLSITLTPTAANVGEADILAASRGTVQWPSGRAQIMHIFRDAPGHFSSDTLANRRSIQSAITLDNFAGFDRFGNASFRQANADGSMTWADTRNGVIQNGGINR